MALAALVALALSGRAAEDEAPPSSIEVVISVADQRLVVLRDGQWIGRYRVSTSKFGLGDSYGSYKTPLGKLRVSEKIGGHLANGAVIKHRHATGEILPVNAPGRDPIVTRVLWLDGLEERNKNSKSRGIYIHGTVEESKIGSPVSYGCVRMRSREVTEVFSSVPVGALVTIQQDKLPKYARWTAPPTVLVAATAPTPTARVKETPPLPKVALSLPPKPDAAEPATAKRLKGKRVAEAPRELPPASPARKTFADNSKKKPARETDAEPAAGSALSGSILFADMPALADKRPASTLESIRGPVLSPVAEAPPKRVAPLEEEEEPPLPRVTFRTGQSRSSTP